MDQLGTRRFVVAFKMQSSGPVTNIWLKGDSYFDKVKNF